MNNRVWLRVDFVILLPASTTEVQQEQLRASDYVLVIGLNRSVDRALQQRIDPFGNPIRIYMQSTALTTLQALVFNDLLVDRQNIPHTL